MTEKTCNFWLEKAEHKCILTSGAVNDAGEAVFDHPLSIEAAKRYSGLATDVGREIVSLGNHTRIIRPGIIAFPIKQYQWSGANLQIIKRSTNELIALVGAATTLLPRPVQGAVPTWEEISAILAALPENIIVVQHV